MPLQKLGIFTTIKQDDHFASRKDAEMKELIFPIQPEQQVAMQRYLKDQFLFCGVKACERRRLEADFLRASVTLPITELVQVVKYNYRKLEREYQYYAIDLVQKNSSRLSSAELALFLPLIGEKSWWDTTDAWRKVFSTFVTAHLKQRAEIFAWFYGHEDFWYRRIAITLQLRYQAATDRKLLAKAIVADRDTPEFFIQKAIGWALRDFSKTDPAWVAHFLQTQALSKLAQREGSKYI